jgi:hypothetical protein
LSLLRLIACTSKKLDIASDDLGCVTFDPLSIFPLPSLQPAFYNDLPPLAEVISTIFSGLAKRDNSMPLGSILPVPLSNGNSVGSGYTDLGNRRAVWSISNFRISP